MKLVARVPGGDDREVVVEPREGGYRLEIGDGVVYEVDVAVSSRERGLMVKSLIVDSGAQHEVAVKPLDGGRYRVSTAGGVAEVELMDPLAYLAEQAHGDVAAGPSQVKAYMPGVVKRVLVAEGDAVTRGQSLAVLEAMKMENEILAEADGTVSKVLVKPGQPVDGGEALFEVA